MVSCRFVAVGTLLLASVALSAQQAPPDAVYYNGKVVTVDANERVAQAFAVRGGEFVAVGTSAAMRALAGRSTTVVDLHGRTVVPGLIDNHNHQYDVALVTQRGVDMKDVPSLAEMLSRLRKAAATPAASATGSASASAPADKMTDGTTGGATSGASPSRSAGVSSATIFTTTGWSADTFPEKRGPTRQELDAISSDRPTVVYATRSRVQVNSAALKVLGISRDGAAAGAERLVIGKDATGEPDGTLSGSPAAFARVMQRLVPPPSLDEKKTIITKIQAQQHAMGLTGIRELQIDPDVMRAYFELWREHALTLRTSVGLNINAGEEDKLQRLLEAWGVGPGFGDDWMRIDGIAEYNPGEQVREPYLGEDGKPGTERGELRVPEERFRQAILTINRLGWRPAIHITGDRTLDLVLDAYEAADRERSIRDRRWIVEHIPLVHPDQIERLKRLGVGVSAQFQPYAGGEGMLRRLGRERAEHALPMRDLLAAGLVVSGGSDWPGAPNNPFVNIYYYVTRQTQRAGVLGAAQKISRQQALRVMTLNNAYLTFEEQRKGSIEAGKLADFVILSDDLLTVPDARLLTITPLATYVGGRRVFAAPAEAGAAASGRPN